MYNWSGDLKQQFSKLTFPLPEKYILQHLNNCFLGRRKYHCLLPVTVSFSSCLILTAYPFSWPRLLLSSSPFLWNLYLSKFSVSKASTEIHFLFLLIHSWAWNVNTTELFPLQYLCFQVLLWYRTFLRSLKITFRTQDKNYLASSYNLTQNVKEGEP